MIMCKIHGTKFTSNGCCPLCPQATVSPLKQPITSKIL